MEKLKDLAREVYEKWRGWPFEKWWSRYGEDLWIFCKQDPMLVCTSTKIVTTSLWFEKNVGVQQIYQDMKKLVGLYMEMWYADHMVPEMPEEDVKFSEEDIPEELLADAGEMDSLVAYAKQPVKEGDYL